MAKTKQRFCVDCLFCKVSAKSTKNNRLCYCSESKSEKNHKEKHWIEKKVCGDFLDMC
ncbi:hypothetical protein TREAZ_1942 [Leadbettera azotonutricia ZAS-9]|uniref:Uncharacterized protein n=1 Tax=Leadbettera azotonutricia (strain ATCC BAA-888 / DSM 13862 / ZAS-9) TaxID=545695 RepID=F5YAR2_LEAAZ|nr:hypothetical protein TREAZ_1942 [Leadbettera azotonutricia ZAS-9]